MNGGRVGATCALLCVIAAPVWAQTAPVRTSVGGRMHYQWNSTSVGRGDLAADAAALAPHSFEQRRVRLTFDAQISDWITGRLEPEFAMGRLGVRNAWMAFTLDPALVVRAGQMKKPFGLVLLTSSNALPVIERGVRIRGLDEALRQSDDGTLSELRGELLVGEHHALLDLQRYSAYDMGVAVEGRRGTVGWAAGVFNGGGPDVRAENAGMSGAARVTWQPPVALPVTLGAAWSRRVINWPLAQSTDTRTGNAWAVDAELGGFRRGPWLIAEATMGDQLVTEQRFVGAQLIASWFLPLTGPRIEGWEPVARVSHGDPDRSVTGDEGTLLTPGVNVYFVGRNRLMLNWDVFVPAGSQFVTQHAVRAQINLNF